MIWAVSCAIVLAGLSVLIHSECLNFLNGCCSRFKSQRTTIVMLMIGLLLAHVVEIWMYAGAFQLLTQFPDIGTIQSTPEADLTFFDMVYFSAMVYTTVGFGDMLPIDGLRVVAATEALVGLSLIAWSASFTYFQLQEQFGKDRGS